MKTNSEVSQRTGSGIPGHAKEHEIMKLSAFLLLTTFAMASPAVAQMAPGYGGQWIGSARGYTIDQIGLNWVITSDEIVDRRLVPLDTQDVARPTPQPSKYFNI